MNEQDMILKIMEMEGRPLMTKEISKLISANYILIILLISMAISYIEEK